MKASEVGSRLKEITGEQSYDLALAAVEQILNQQKPRPPLGVTLTLDPRQTKLYWPVLLGSFQSIEEIKILQRACRDFADVMLANLLEQAIVASANNSDKPTTEK